MFLLNGVFQVATVAANSGLKRISKAPFTCSMTVQHFTCIFHLWGRKKFFYIISAKYLESKCDNDFLLDIWPKIIKLIDYCSGLPASKQLQCENYIKNANSNAKTKAKLLDFNYLTGLLQPYLKIYQTNQTVFSDNLKALMGEHF